MELIETAMTETEETPETARRRGPNPDDGWDSGTGAGWTGGGLTEYEPDTREYTPIWNGSMSRRGRYLTVRPDDDVAAPPQLRRPRTARYRGDGPGRGHGPPGRRR